ncbi:HPr(Ser) kinase/phosphatase [Blautia hominis]|uniref:HPr kinase/phosphorylase n=1 Tax=Blautia hominis TaxID=2025493 RepID=A0ABQ0BG26_9FIRM
MKKVKRNVKLSKFVKDLSLETWNTTINYEDIEITKCDINRLGIQLTGFLEFYDPHRIEILGNVEIMYLNGLDEDTKRERYMKLMEKGAPCFVFCRGLKPDNTFSEIATEKRIPIFLTMESTSNFMSDAIKWLNNNLGETIVIHGCLVDVFGTGIFIQGESGIGKSETTLELIKRGHRMIADDAVEIHKASDVTLYGKAPDNIKDFIELRGIGILDVKELFGVQAVLETQTIELVVTLQEWNNEAIYDRIGLENKFIEILGNKIPNYIVPIRPGRNVAIILETAALKYRQMKMGGSPAEKFLKVQEKVWKR